MKSLVVFVVALFLNLSLAKEEGTCGDLPVIAHGSFSFGSSTYGSHRHIQCNTGYDVIGDEIVTCQFDGKWKVDGHCADGLFLCQLLF